MGASSDFFRMDSGVSAQPAATPLPLILAAVVLCTLPMIVLSQLAAHWRFDVVDDQMFGYFGWRIANGATVYVDVWDNKPPGIYWINALGFLISGDRYAGVIALCGVATVASLAAFFVICASVYYRGAAALTTILASFYLTHGFFQGGTNRTETFLVAFELVAVALYVRGFARDRNWKWLVAGLCCGCAFLCKQVGLAAWGVMGLHTILLVLMGDLNWRVGLRRCVLLAVGCAIPVGLAAAALAAQGALDDAIYATFEFNQAYFAAGSSRLLDNFANRYWLRQHMDPILRVPMLLGVAGVLHALFWWVRPHLRPADIESPIKRFGAVCPRYFLLFCGWFGVAFYGAVLSPHAFEHYLVPVIPPLMLIAGYTINVLRTEIGTTRRMQQRIWVTLAFIVMIYGAVSAFDRHVEELSQVWVYRFEQGRRAEWEDLGDQVARLTRPDERIQCFGYMPGVYLHARRLNASRYTTTEKIGQLYYTPEAEAIRQEMIRTLSADPPAAIVMYAGEYLLLTNPGLTDDPIDSLGQWLGPFLKQNYTVAFDYVPSNIYILMRNDRVPPGLEVPSTQAVIERVKTAEEPVP